MSRTIRRRVAAGLLTGIAAAGVLASLAPAAGATHRHESAAPDVRLVALPYGPATCKQGYVWRTAAPEDLVCVTPATRQTTHEENALAASRREPGGGAWGPETCKSGFVWRLAFPKDLVCVTPDRRDQAAADNAKAAERRAVDPATLPEAQRPGRHTMVLEVERSQVRREGKVFPPKCTNGQANKPIGTTVVGWSQFEADGDPCQAGVVETAVRFDQRALDRIPTKVIDRAVLTYGETAARGCIWPGEAGDTCWRNGDGDPQTKKNGCVAKLAFPTVDWTRTTSGGLLPNTTFAQVKRVTPTEWDVSDPFRWQYTRSAPLGGSPPPPHGFLLSGGVGLHQLTAEDSTHCVSALSRIQLHVTYTVPPERGGEFIPPR
ncbi:hypothetical protein [Pseudonocardia xishanensis]|uniref:Uncharacterized protein n=1 Tax=Pseudonocardia xishanensis TaxID=630995 RepID=A0ABP8RTH1_9PSEU